MFKTPSACIEADQDAVAKVVLMPGDPLRAKYIAETYLENPVLLTLSEICMVIQELTREKGFLLWEAVWEFPLRFFMLMSSIPFFGVETIIRVGSTGALLDDMECKDIVIAMGACTNSNMAHHYNFPGTLAPTADFELLYDAVNICKERGTRIKVGNVFSTDLFYNAQPDVPTKARDLGMLCVEMETAGLYLESLAQHKKALSILSVSDHFFKPEALTAQEIRESFNEMMGDRSGDCSKTRMTGYLYGQKTAQ